jgi:2-polyprenyl-6-methoxyphenol hydroxylase-like FAD-dependent oxidoreductase
MPEPYRNNTPILICGAGPTGLVLALWLAKRHLPFRIIDKSAEAGTASRALVVQARTLEFYRQLGIVDGLIEGAQDVDQIHFWVRQAEKGVAQLGAVATEISPYPFFLVFPQDEHEVMLERELNKFGVRVERNTELIGFEETAAGIDACLRDGAGKIEMMHVDYLAGCDGVRSKVRETIGANFPGGTYEHTFYVADVIASGPTINGDLNLALDDADFLAVFPMKGEGRARFIGTVNPAQTDRTFEWSDVSQDILRRLRLDIQKVNWFSTYRVHHRVASRFRKGRAFLLGDAAHVHSPVGGQGMNTGIGDAVNLAWKLDAILRQGVAEAILDTYEQERVPFARSLVGSTDRAFAFINQRGPLARTIRTRLMPLIIPRLFKSAAFRRAAFRLVSQTRIRYPKSALSYGAAGNLHGGDRLPWLPQQDNFAPLTILDWQVHCYGAAPMAITDWCRHAAIPLHVFAPATCLAADTLCLIRPDGYIGWVGHSADLNGLTRYAAQWQLARTATHQLS